MAFENMTPEVIREAIIENTGSSVSTQEGSFASDMAAPVALEMSKVYGEIDKTLDIMFVEGDESAGGEYLDRRASEFGIQRKPGIKATGAVTFTGSNGTTVRAGTIATTGDGLRYVTDSDVMIAPDTATVNVTATDVGVAYNVPAGEVSRMHRNLVGVQSVTNAEPIMGGQDTETDEALRERLLIRMRTPATSGNIYHYMQWALEVPGVGAAKITPLQYGNGTVGILIVGNNKEPVAPEVVAACLAHIETERPIGASPTVASAVGLGIAVTASVHLSGGASLSDVQAKFAGLLQEHLESIAFVDYTLSYNRVSFLLMSVEGVLDYASLLINGDDENITIADNEVPVLQGVTLNAII